MIDTHCHIFKEYYENIDEIINSTDGYMIVAGVDDKSNLEVVELVNNYDNVYGVIGIQPEEVEHMTDSSIDIIEKNITNPKIIGVGEIGLDYHFDDSNKEHQQVVFRKMLDIALKYNKTVVIHSRDAILDTYNILSEYKGLKSVLHCYSSSLEMAKKFINMDVMLGIGGVVTFKNAKKLVEVVKDIPLDYLLLETDSPYLSPEPYRGKTNIPNNIKLVAQKIAEIKGISYDEVIKKTTKNAIKQFNIDL